MGAATVGRGCVSGRSSAAVAAAVRSSILESRLPFGDFLPSVRELAREHSVDMKTALRAMKVLESEGLVQAVRGQGFRVLARACAPVPDAPVAHIGVRVGDRQLGSGATVELGHALQQAAARRGWCLMSVTDDVPLPQMLATLRGHKVLGAVVSSFNSELIAGLVAEGLPLVLVDSSIANAAADAVMQDGQMGGRLAADFALERGRARFAWLGNVEGGAHLADRLGGAMARLHESGHPLDPGLVCVGGLDQAEAEIRRFLSRKERPDAIIAPWANYMLAAARACKSLGLEAGRDVDLVGWSNQELLERDLAAHLSPESVSAVVTWSAREMAETALARLIQRRESPELPPVLIKVPTRLISLSGADR